MADDEHFQEMTVQGARKRSLKATAIVVVAADRLAVHYNAGQPQQIAGKDEVRSLSARRVQSTQPRVSACGQRAADSGQWLLACGVASG